MELEGTLTQTPEQLSQASQLSELIPDVPGYSIGERIGSGSFGTVYRAVQLRTGQTVAIKVLRREAVNCSYFQHELAKLSEIAEHPHVVSLLDADLDYLTPYFVMPYLAAGSLAHRQPETGWVKRVVEWLTQVAQALNYMHGKGLLHCDLKPSNVLLDEGGRARLVDFGQASKIGDEAGAFGTLGYMPAEQAVLNAQPDARWDVYGWGATAYRLLCGQCPRFTQEDHTELTRTPEVVERLQLYRKWVNERPLVPLRTLNPHVDGDLCEIIENCLVVDPERRTDSVRTILEDLDRRRSGDPLLCKRPWSTRYKVVRFVGRPIMALALLVVIGLPMFVNTYLTLRARFALEKQILREAKLINRLTAEHLRQQGTRPPRLASREGYQHFLLDAEGRLVVATTASTPDLAAMEKESGMPDGGFYHRDRVYLVGAWSKLGPWTLVSEREAVHAMDAANELLNKNQLLNAMILLSAAGTAILVARFSRR